MTKTARFIDEVAAIQTALDAGNTEATMHLAPRAKGLAGSIGAARLQSAALALEMALRGETRYEKEILDEFSQSLKVVIDGIGSNFGLTPPVG
ncbi:Hpt domain-containing protein [Dechloromonas sp.]|uniref:Hpt domain-containing protein n=1 Tax=Dechloromonas sp. TaxID=1917218 RepID=UPI001227CB37|nr:Hpt domain-containing protein [Dechloromonas sp.]MBU3697679.1 Hpt domain-containing protein [Dechloromonas sp.]TEX44755.1 MAG: hypothetical protein CFR70_12565 [Rhodocyclaceae bacterium]